MHYLYKITNTINQKVYIGQTINIRSRWSNHRTEAKQDKPKWIISKAIKKHKIENFIFEVIATCKTYEDANELETILIQQHQSHISTGKGYNIALGGKNSSPSAETRKKLSDFNKGKKLSKAHKKKMSVARMGRIVSEDTRKKLSLAHTGRKASEETKKKMSESHMGHKHSEKTKKKMSKRIVSEENKKKLSERWMGKNNPRSKSKRK